MGIYPLIYNKDKNDHNVIMRYKNIKQGKQPEYFKRTKQA